MPLLLQLLCQPEIERYGALLQLEVSNVVGQEHAVSFNAAMQRQHHGIKGQGEQDTQSCTRALLASHRCLSRL